MTAAQALKHPWIAKFITPEVDYVLSEKTAHSIIQLLDDAKLLSNFQFFNMLIMVELLSLAANDFIATAKNLFIAIDSNQSGEISLQELTDFMKKHCQSCPDDMSQRDVLKMFK